MLDIAHTGEVVSQVGIVEVIVEDSSSHYMDAYIHCTWAAQVDIAGAGVDADSGCMVFVFPCLPACLALPADDDRSSYRRGNAFPNRSRPAVGLGCL